MSTIACVGGGWGGGEGDEKLKREKSLMHDKTLVLELCMIMNKELISFIYKTIIDRLYLLMLVLTFEIILVMTRLTFGSNRAYHICMQPCIKLQVLTGDRVRLFCIDLVVFTVSTASFVFMCTKLQNSHVLLGHWQVDNIQSMCHDSECTLEHKRRKSWHFNGEFDIIQQGLCGNTDGWN